MALRYALNYIFMDSLKNLEMIIFGSLYENTSSLTNCQIHHFQSDLLFVKHI